MDRCARGAGRGGQVCEGSWGNGQVCKASQEGQAGVRGEPENSAAGSGQGQEQARLRRKMTWQHSSQDGQQEPYGHTLCPGCRPG